MQDKLRAAFSKKEKAEMFLANLEKLKEEKNVGDAQYRVLKIEYTQMRDDAVSEINSVKNSVKKELDGRASKLEVLKQELGYLETRFKVGQLTSATYLAKEKGPKKQATELEKRIAELRNFLSATGSSELIAIPESSIKILGMNLGLSRKQPQDEAVPAGAPNVPATITPIVAPESVQAPPPPPPPPPPPTPTPPPPPPPPPMIKTEGLQIMPDCVMEGGSMGIIVTVTNITMGNVQQKVELKINDEVKDSQDINLLPGESQEITFITSGGKSGSYQVNINGITGIFNVMAANSVRYLR